MDLKTTYMGMELKNPIVPSSTPLSEDVDKIKHMEAAGAAAVVMFSVFEEQIKQEQHAQDIFTNVPANSFAEAVSYFPEIDDYTVGVDSYIDLVAEAADAVDIPIIGSINGITNDSWIDYATRIESAGAAGLELNVFYLPTDLTKTGQDIENMYLDVVKAVKASVNIPVAVKLNPFFSSTANMAKQLDDAGADALVLFNRFYQPDFNLEELVVESKLELSTASEIRLPLLWLSVLHGRLDCSLAATTGVHSVREVLKYLMAGADITMVASSLLLNGIDYISVLLRDLEQWMIKHEYESVEQMKGSMCQINVDNPDVFERANYIKLLKSYDNPYMI